MLMHKAILTIAHSLNKFRAELQLQTLNMILHGGIQHKNLGTPDDPDKVLPGNNFVGILHQKKKDLKLCVRHGQLLMVEVHYLGFLVNDQLIPC